MDQKTLLHLAKMHSTPLVVMDHFSEARSRGFDLRDIRDRTVQQLPALFAHVAHDVPVQLLPLFHHREERQYFLLVMVLFSIKGL